MATDPALRDILTTLPALSAVLDDLNVAWVVLRPTGAWSFEKLGRVRKGQELIPSEASASLVGWSESGTTRRHGEWYLRVIHGYVGPTLLFERLPSAVVDRLPARVLQSLKERVRIPGNGVIMGRPGSGKNSLLLWLAHQLQDETVVYISENPPVDPPAGHIVHVWPPEDDVQRRDLQRLARLSTFVMWDRIGGPTDIATLYGFSGAKHRWFTLDASSVRSGLAALQAALKAGYDARIQNVLVLRRSVIGRPEVAHLLTSNAGVWQEEFREGDDSCLALLEGFSADSPAFGDLAEISGPLMDSPAPLPVAGDRADETPPSMSAPLSMEDSGARKTLDAPLTLEVPEDAVLEIDAEAVQPVDVQDSPTSMLGRQQYEALAQQSADAEEARLPEVTRQYSMERAFKESTQEADTSYIEQVISNFDDSKEHEKMDLENLRITHAGYIEEFDFDLEDSEADLDESGDDFSQVYESVVLEEISQDSFDEELKTSVADSISIGALKAVPPPDISHEEPTESRRIKQGELQETVTAERPYNWNDSTEQVPVRDRLQRIRNRIRRNEEDES